MAEEQPQNEQEQQQQPQVVRKAEINRKKKFVNDGVFYAELNSFLRYQLLEEGYCGVEVRSNTIKTEIIILATKAQNIIGEKGKRIRELSSMIQKRFGFAPGTIELFADRVPNRGLCALAQAESLRYKLAGGLAVRRAAYGVLRFAMESGAKGVQVRISGKLRQERAKTMKFRDGYMIKSGNHTRYCIDVANRYLFTKQGILGVQVKIMLPYDANAKPGSGFCPVPQPDVVVIKEPKEEPTYQPYQPQQQQQQPQQQAPAQQQQQQPAQPAQQQPQQQQQAPAQQQPQAAPVQH